MTPARLLAGALALSAGLLLVPAGPARAADPGLPFPASDMNRGSLLLFSLVATDPANPAAQDTRLALTNFDPSAGTAVRLFIVDGATGAAASQTLCLGPAETTALDPAAISGGFTGFAVAVAVDPATGCPLAFNRLGGQARVRLASGFRATLEAVAVEVVGALPACNLATTTVTLSLNNAVYGPIPRTLLLDSFPSLAEGRTLLVLNRVGGDLQAGVAPLPPLSGVAFDDAENNFAFGFVPSAPQVVSPLSDTFPAVVPALSTVVPAGRTGHLKVTSPAADTGLLGAVLYDAAPGGTGGGTNRREALAGGAPFAREGGANLRGLTLSQASAYSFTRQTPGCTP